MRFGVWCIRGMRAGRTSWRGMTGVEVVEGDLRDFDDVTRAVQGV